MRTIFNVFLALIALASLSFQKKVVIDFGTGFVKAGYAGKLSSFTQLTQFYSILVNLFILKIRSEKTHWAE